MEQIKALLLGSEQKWNVLKNSWSQLGLPGSPFMVHDVIVHLLLASLIGSEEEIAEKLKAGAAMYDALKYDPQVRHLLTGNSPVLPLTVLISTRDAYIEPVPVLPVLADAVAETFPETQPQVTQQESEPLTSCPYCDHIFEKCLAGEYVQPEPAEAPIVEPEGEAEELESPEPVSGCIHIGSDGKCASCTEDETVDCSRCDETVVLDKAYKCLNYDNCGHAYCEGDKGELTEYGYCDDCHELECDADGCDNEIEAGTQKDCANESCTQYFCDGCAPCLFNEKGFCPTCSGEELFDCDGCDTAYTESLITMCKGKDCEVGFCGDCKGDYLTEGLCSDCEEVEV